jgi:hypothetical protein
LYFDKTPFNAGKSAFSRTTYHRISILSIESNSELRSELELFVRYQNRCHVVYKHGLERYKCANENTICKFSPHHIVVIPPDELQQKNFLADEVSELISGHRRIAYITGGKMSGKWLK